MISVAKIFLCFFKIPNVSYVKSSCGALSEYLYLLLTNNYSYYIFWINLLLLCLGICVLEIQISTIVLNPLIVTQRRANVVFITGITFRYVHCTPYTGRTEAGKRGIAFRYVQCTVYGEYSYKKMSCTFVQLILAQINTLLLYSLYSLTFSFKTVQCNL